MRALRRIAARADALAYALRAGRRGTRGAFERALGLELYVPPSVLNPVLFRTGVLLAKAARAESASGARVLDMGAGTGIVALAAARRGARVVAIDKNPVAIRATRVNAMLNALDVDAREGDLFEPCEGMRFDLIAFNPPFFQRGQGGDLSLALADGPGLPTLARFLAEARAHLSASGQLLIAGSSHGALEQMRALYATHRYDWVTVRSVERIAERLVVDRLLPRLAEPRTGRV